MRKILIDLFMIALIAGLPFFGFMSTRDLDKMWVVAILTTTLISVILFIRHFLTQEFFFEKWLPQ